MYSSFALAMGLHALFCMVMFFAVVCGVVWIVRFASKAQLKSWFWGLMLFGVIGCALTGFAFGSMYNMMDDRWDDDDSMEDLRDDMMDWDDDEGTTTIQ